MNLPPPTERQSRLMWTGASALAIIFIIILIAGVIWGLGRVLSVLSPVIWPIAIAGIVAYLLDPVVDFMERRKVPRARAILCVFFLAFVLVGGVLSAVIPQLVIETNQLAGKIPDYASKARARVQEVLAHPPKFLEMFLPHGTTQAPPPGPAPVAEISATTSTTNTAAVQPSPTPADTNFSSGLAPETAQKAAALVASALPGFGKWLFGQATRVASWFGILAGLALIPVYAFYFLLKKEPISSRWTDYLPVRDSRFKTELVFVLTSMNNYLIAFFRGQVLVAICDGILYAIGFLIIGLPYAVLIGFAGIFLTIIPFLGAFVICATALLIALFQFGDWAHPLMVIGVFAVVQALEGLVISPRIMGNRVGLHPVAIIIAVMAGTTLLGGLLGGILAIPLAAALRVIMFRYVWTKPTETIS